MHAFNPNTAELEAKSLGVQGKSLLHNKFENTVDFIRPCLIQITHVQREREIMKLSFVKRECALWFIGAAEFRASYYKHVKQRK